MRQVLLGQRTVYENLKMNQFSHNTTRFDINFYKIPSPETPLRRRATAHQHVIGVTTIGSNNCLHYFRLKVYCNLNLLLTQIFERGLDVVDEATIGLP